MKNEYKMLAEINVALLKEVEVERAKVRERDTQIAELWYESATNWAVGYFSFQGQGQIPRSRFRLRPSSIQG